MPTLAGKVVVVTGASAGIGAATALALARGGAKVVLAARRREKLEQVAEQCRVIAAKGGVEGGAVEVVMCDVAKRADVDRLVAVAVEKFERLDVMIANAGYGFLA